MSIYLVSIVCQVEDYQNILKLSSRPLAFTSFEVFVKSKKRSGTSFPASFSAWLLRKNIFLVTFYYLIKFHCLVAFTLWEIAQYVYCNCLLTRLWRHKFLKLTLSFLSSRFFFIVKTSGHKISEQRKSPTLTSQKKLLIPKICDLFQLY